LDQNKAREFLREVLEDKWMEKSNALRQKLELGILQKGLDSRV